MNKLMAFWKYDMFPYLLWGEVYYMENDKVLVKGYEGISFYPVLIVEYEFGKKLATELERIKRQRNDNITNINERFNSKLQDLLKEFDVDNLIK